MFDDEIEKIKKIPNKTKYYATIENNSLNIYTKPPTNTTKIKDQSIIDFVADTINSYNIVDNAVPNNTDYIEFYMFESTSEIPGIDEFKVSDNPYKYFFPSVSTKNVDEPEKSKKTKGTPITGGTDPRKLVVSTKFDKGGTCSGIVIGNDNDKSYIYTAAHCLKTPGQTENPPDSAIMDNKPITLVTNSSNKLYNIPINQTQTDNSNKYYIEHADDVGIFYTTTNSDTTNVFLLNNCHEIPKNTSLKYWGTTTGKWSQSKLFDDSDIIGKIVTSGNISYDDFDKVYPDWRTKDGAGNYTYEGYKQYFRIVETSPQAGDSGGPHGFFFNRDTRAITDNGDCFAICFTTGTSVSDGTNSHGLVISASRWIDWIKKLDPNLIINIARYENGKIEIVPPTTSGGSKKTFRTSRRKYTTK